VVLTPTFFAWPFRVGVGPVMFLVAAVDGLALHFGAH
jgi:hypothetical protein